MGSSRFVSAALAVALFAPPGGSSSRGVVVAPQATTVAAPAGTSLPSNARPPAASAASSAPGEKPVAPVTPPVAPLPPVAEPPLVPYEELRRRPAQHLARRVRIVVQLEGGVASWNPYLSRFGMRDYAAFRAWSDEQLPWQLEDYEAPAVRFFVRRASPSARAFDGLPEFARCELVVRVAELFAGEPWLEVERVRRLELQLTEGTVIHAGRAHEFLEQGQWALAESELERALAGALPEGPRAELERLSEICRAERESARAPRTGPTKQP